MGVEAAGLLRSLGTSFDQRGREWNELLTAETIVEIAPEGVNFQAHGSSFWLVFQGHGSTPFSGRWVHP
jgi:hypothetical protein